MQAQAGIVKSVVGGAMVIDQSGAQRSLKAGDMVYLGEKIVTQDASSKVVITQNDGRDVTMIGKDALVLDQSIAAQESFGNETVTADISALQQALLEGTQLQSLEETAAGGNTDGGAASSDGVSLSQVVFTHGGHISNVTASYGDLASNQVSVSSEVFASAAASGVAENANSQQ
ncbi:retention module-containing protein, partial [Campylobacter rectus]